MGNSNYFDELIVSYLLNELNSEEEEFVLEWINSNEENKQYFEALRGTWNLLAAEQAVNEISVDDEWSRFRQTIGARPGAHSLAVRAPVADRFSEQEIPGKKSKVLKIFLLTAVAASFLLVIFFAWQITSHRPSRNPPGSLAVQPGRGDKALVKREVNTTGSVRSIMLPDGSQVKLSKESEISYQVPFEAGKRDIVLTGKAHFKVAKDKSRPFTVYSGDISTTALGTEFTVAALAGKKNIVVRLYEGRVVVKSSDKAQRKLGKDYYLLPGQELTYDYRRLTAKIKIFTGEAREVEEKANRKESLSADNPTFAKLNKGNWYMFNNQPLSQVFEQLEDMFKIDIVYSKKDVAKIYFIGSFNNTDSLTGILKQIGSLNNLKITRKDNKVIISR